MPRSRRTSARCPECARLAAALRPAIELFEEAVGPQEGHDLPSYWGEVAVESSEPRSASRDTVRQVRSARRRSLAQASQAVSELSVTSIWQVAALVALGVFVGSLLRGFAPLEAGRSPAGTAPTSRTAVRPAPTRGGSPTIIVTTTPARAGERTTSPSDAGDRELDEHSFVNGTRLDGHQTVRLPRACLDLLPGGLAEGGRPTDLEDESGWLERRYVDIDQCCTRCHNAAPDALVPRSATAAVQKSCRYCHVN